MLEDTSAPVPPSAPYRRARAAGNAELSGLVNATT
jgi:hypothetical protein